MKRKSSIVAQPKQGEEVPPGYIDVTRQTSNLRHRWEWAEESIWNDKMLIALENGVKGGKCLLRKSWTLYYGKCQRSRNSVSVTVMKLLTGEPYALIAHVRFGGRCLLGGAYPYLFILQLPLQSGGKPPHSRRFALHIFL